MAGCDAQPTAASDETVRPLGKSCAVDNDCAFGFCDLGICAMPEGVYGQPCKVAPLGADGLRDGKLNMCGAYVCSQERCRSCGSDAQCQEEYGAPLCVARPNRPGIRCGA
jgi:hypothetical protein